MTEHTSGRSREIARHANHGRRFSRAWWIFAAVALFYLLTEHQAHLFGILPWLFPLACPVMHLFMHHGHGGHGHGDNRGNEKEEK